MHAHQLLQRGQHPDPHTVLQMTAIRTHVYNTSVSSGLLTLCMGRPQRVSSFGL